MTTDNAPAHNHPTTSIDAAIAALEALVVAEMNARVAADKVLEARVAKLEAAPPPIVTPPPVTARAAGVYVHNSAWNFALLDQYATTAGRKPAFAMTYQMFGHSGDGWQFDTKMLDAFTSRGITPMMSWQPYDWGLPQNNQPAYSLSHLLAGDFDTYIGTWVTAAKAYAKPLWIRFAHEMNGDFYPWGQRVNGNTPAQYVAAFRKVVDMFRAGGATNVRWIWSPNVTGLQGQYPLTGLYPGDAYVDMVGIDGYNWGTSGKGEPGWVTFTKVFGSTYDQLRVIAPSKPIYIAEAACSDAGGDKAAWITSAYLTEIPARFPALTGFLWFDVNGAFDAHWSISTPPTATPAYKAVVADPTWQGKLP